MEVKLPNNSEKALAEASQKKVQQTKVISGKVKHHTSMGKLLRQTFIPEDVSNARDYILADLVMPAIKNGIFDTVLNIIDYWRGGGGTYRRTNTSAPARYTSGQQTSYNNRYAPRISQGPSEPVSQRYAYDDIVIEDYAPADGGSARAKADAEAVLVSLQSTIDQYSVARVTDLFEFVGVTSTPADYNYGWTNISSAYTKRVSGGWLLVLPKAMAIDNN